MSERVGYGGDSGAWFRRFDPEPGTGTRPVLVCFPHAGGAASVWRPLSAALRGRADVVAVQYPGRQDRLAEPPAAGVVELAEGVVRAWPSDLRGPFVLFGHSMGAVVAFEVARRLRADGRGGPAALVVSGSPAPGLVRRGGVHALDDAGFTAALRELGGVPEAVLAEPELLPLVLPPVRADFRAIETYACRPGAPLDVPVTALAADADPRARVAEVEAWRGCTRAAFSLQVVPGGHFAVVEDPVGLAERLAAVPGVGSGGGGGWGRAPERA